MCGLKVALSPFSILLPPGKAQAQPAQSHGQGLFPPRDRTVWISEASRRVLPIAIGEVAGFLAWEWGILDRLGGGGR